MQITIQESRVVKTGANKNGEWELIRVTSQDNTEYTTFDKKAKHLTNGSVIEFEPIIKEGKLSFKVFKLISEGQVSTPSPGAKSNGMTPEAWAEKDRLERFSIESQVAFKGIIALGIVEKPSEKLRIAHDLALDWAIDHLKMTSVKADIRTAERAERDIEELWPEDPPHANEASQTAVAAETIPSEPEPEPVKEANLDFDPDWLLDSLKQVHWKDSTVKSYLKNVYKVDTEGTVVDVVARLSREQLEAFTKEIQDRLAML